MPEPSCGWGRTSPLDRGFKGPGSPEALQATGWGGCAWRAASPVMVSNHDLHLAGCSLQSEALPSLPEGFANYLAASVFMRGFWIFGGR
jgi:hypothetical protein